MLSPSGGHLFFSGEERIWKERRRAGRGVPRPTNPPPWVGVGGVGGIVPAARQICQCIRALAAGEQTACRFAVAYGLRWGLDGFFTGEVAAASYFFPCNRANALRGPYSFFFGEERIWKERRRAGRGVPRPTNPPPWVGVGGAGGLYGLPGKFASASVPCKPVSRPLAASLALTRVRLWLGGWRGRWLLR